MIVLLNDILFIQKFNQSYQYRSSIAIIMFGKMYNSAYNTIDQTILTQIQLSLQYHRSNNINIDLTTYISVNVNTITITIMNQNVMLWRRQIQILFLGLIVCNLTLSQQIMPFQWQMKHSPYFMQHQYHSELQWKANSQNTSHHQIRIHSKQKANSSNSTNLSSSNNNSQSSPEISNVSRIADNKSTTSSQTYALKEGPLFFTLKLTIAELVYNLAIDTGSSDTYIKGQSSNGVPAIKYQCSSCMINNSKLELEYQDGKIQAYSQTLPIILGAHSFSQSLLVAYEVGQNLQASEGLIGLSFMKLAKSSNPTFLSTLINNNIISEYSFGINLNFQMSERSFITFGGFDEQFFTGSLSYYSLINDSFYMVTINGIQIANSTIMSISTAILDTGNTCISIPIDFSDQILDLFNDQHNTCDFNLENYAPDFSLLMCKITNFDSLPSLAIQMPDNKSLKIEKQVYLKNCVRDPSETNASPEIWYCKAYIQTVKSDILYLGDGFFNRFYTYFDIENKRVGIALNLQTFSIENLKHPSNNSSNQFNSDDWSTVNQKEQQKNNSQTANNGNIFSDIGQFFKDQFPALFS